MNTLLPIVVFLVGVALGAAIAWFFMRIKLEHAEGRGRSDAEAELASLGERVQNREAAIEQLNAQRVQNAELISKFQAAHSELNSRISQLSEACKGKEELVKEARTELSKRAEEIRSLQHAGSQLNQRITQLTESLRYEQEQAREKLAVYQDAEKKLLESFKVLASDTLKNNNQTFVEFAKAHFEKFQEGAKTDLDKRQEAIVALVKPMKESLEKVDGKIVELEKARVGAYNGLTEQVKSLIEMQKDLRTETSKLVTALRTPHARGHWGEVQLRRVVELAGMVAYCDFAEQQSINTEDGRLRPDLVVNLPSNKTIVVDSKTPLSAYLEAIEAADDVLRAAKLVEHAQQVRTHMQALGKKSYFDQFQSSPEFVVMFIPGESIFGAALANDPSLIEFGAEQKVIIATPTTLIALLRAVAYGWRQEQLAQNAQDISDLGRELYKRISTWTGYMADVGKGLQRATNSYNSAVGSLSTRVFSTARKFTDLGIADEELEQPAPIETMVRTLEVPELVPLLEEAVAGEEDGSPEKPR